MQKKLIDRARRRRVPAQFSWVDHRLIRRRLLSGRSSLAWALYLLLVTVADADGLSYYAEGTLCGHLGCDALELARARQELLLAGLIAWEAPLYQVLGLERSGDDARTAAAAAPRAGQTAPLGELLESLREGGAQ